MSHNAESEAPVTRLSQAVRAADDPDTGQPHHREQHRQVNRLRDVILGGQDGLVNILGSFSA
jgi:hypothetical protein